MSGHDPGTTCDELVGKGESGGEYIRLKEKNDEREKNKSKCRNKKKLKRGSSLMVQKLRATRQHTLFASARSIVRIKSAKNQSILA